MFAVAGQGICTQHVSTRAYPLVHLLSLFLLLLL
jgi:hypothetical protein